MKGKNSLLIASVVYLILGLILLFFPGLTTSLFCTAVGALLLLYGAVTIISFFVHRDGGRGFSLQAELILGVISAIVGIFFLTRPSVILSILPVILGLYILIDALVNLKRGLDLRACGYAGWTTTLILSLVSLILGAIILWNPFATQLLLVRVIGAAFLYQGGSDLWAILTLNQYTRDPRD
ncbi:MAG: HdeD family acid-resistance protein [Oscillospiraceae bacterium]|jgi:uncharacterized membrane protein HdeD (DUF308 family)